MRRRMSPAPKGPATTPGRRRRAVASGRRPAQRRRGHRHVAADSLSDATGVPTLDPADGLVAEPEEARDDGPGGPDRPASPPSHADGRPGAHAFTGDDSSVGGPVSAGWREGTLTRVKELATLCEWAELHSEVKDSRVFVRSIHQHLEAASQAARFVRANPKDRFPRRRTGAMRERAKSNLDAAEAQLLNFAPASYVLGQMPGLLTHVQCHLIPTDPRRVEFERLARWLGIHEADHPPQQAESSGSSAGRVVGDRLAIVREERGSIVTAVRAASSASLREQVRVRSFRDTLVVTSAFMSVLVVAVAVVGFFWPTMIPLCFAPEDGGQTMVVCPTAQSPAFPPAPEAGATAAEQSEDIDDFVRLTASRQDIIVVELIGLAAAAVAAAGAIRGIRGTSERSLLPVALAVLKLPTGAITAFLGLLLMRGQFVPGLSALDSSAQILAWALVFGYAQQLFTRLVDKQGQTVLDGVRGADKEKPQMTPP
jgi:hypothetical protein